MKSNLLLALILVLVSTIGRCHVLQNDTKHSLPQPTEDLLPDRLKWETSRCDFHEMAPGDECLFVKTNCKDVRSIFDYLQLRYCYAKSPFASILVIIVLVCWMVLLISILASTADCFLMPSLSFLSHELRLSPGVAGMTLLAFGNGAPDVFTALAGLEADDFSLTLGSLVGASMCVSSFVLGTHTNKNPVDSP